MTAKYSGDDNNSTPRISTSQIEERHAKDETTDELYMRVSHTIVLKRKKKLLYHSLVFNDNLTIDALVDSRAYVGAIAQNGSDRIKQQAPALAAKSMILPFFDFK